MTSAAPSDVLKSKLIELESEISRFKNENSALEKRRFEKEIVCLLHIPRYPVKRNRQIYNDVKFVLTDSNYFYIYYVMNILCGP